mmetsp:Transcript_2641/g.9650  ORF Transcript_2641/g.9650 Transcript_2641/m.9650 type:complete len:234 (+) Transcript_2641:202-903(+)
MEQAELCYGQDASLWLACPDLGVGPGVESAVPRFASRSVGSLEAVSQSLCSPPATTAEAGVFFVHGTLKSRHDATLHNADVRSEITDHTRGYVLSQVAAFNGVARCYVPHYRQSTFFPVGSRQILRERFDVAYGDVLAAFEAFLAFHQGPFFLASHSQGSVHALRLLRERFDDSLRQRLVAAYCESPRSVLRNVVHRKPLRPRRGAADARGSPDPARGVAGRNRRAPRLELCD